MPKKRVKKTDRSNISEINIREAIKAVLSNRLSQYKAAQEYQVKRQTIQSRIKKLLQHKTREELLQDWEDSGNESDDNTTFSNKYTSRQVFNCRQEDELVKYIKTCSNLNYGLTYHQIRTLAYHYAKVIKDIKLPMNWDADKLAGLDWLRGFMQRHRNEIALRKPENTSLSRSMAFNKPVVNEFFSKYSTVLEKYHFRANQIYNLDETGLTTVMPPVKVVAPKGKKQVAHISSQERGDLVTFVGIISASGVAIPPVFVYPRIRNPDDYLGDDYPNSAIAIGSKTGWMTTEIFPKVIEHFANHVKCSVDSKALLLVDNHESHISVNAIQLCREKGIVLLSFPPHTTHRLQPLDIGIYGPFKTYFRTAQHDWLLTNPGKVITIRHLGRMAKIAYERAFTIKNITNSFKSSGLWPLNQLIFSDSDFAASEVTDRQLPIDEQDSSISKSLPSATTPYPSTSKAPPSTPPPLLTEIRPYPKATLAPKKRNTQKAKSSIYTDTPELEKRQGLEEEKKRRESIKKSKTVKRNIDKALNKTRKVSSSSDSSVDILLNESSDGEENLTEISEADKISVGNFVLVKFTVTKSDIYYVAKILSLPDPTSEDFEISFLRRRGHSNNFVFPDVEDIAMINKNDIVAILPFCLPQGTSRVSNVHKFNINFDGLNVR